MKPSDREQDIVWVLDPPARDGIYWVKELSTGRKFLIRVFVYDGVFIVGYRKKGCGSNLDLRRFSKRYAGKVAYCGPDRAPPEV